MLVRSSVSFALNFMFMYKKGGFGLDLFLFLFFGPFHASEIKYITEYLSFLKCVVFCLRCSYSGNLQTSLLSKITFVLFWSFHIFRFLPFFFSFYDSRALL